MNDSYALKKPFLYRQINLESDKFGSFMHLPQLDNDNVLELRVQKIDYKKINNVFKKVNRQIFDDGKELFNSSTYIPWLNYQSQKLVSILGFKIHVDFKIEDICRGFFIQRTATPEYTKEYWNIYIRKYY
jgi:hypothetical protein